MKIAGKKLDGPSIETVVLPRQDGDVVIKAQAVLEYDEFEKICPQPEPPEVILKGGEKSYDFEDKNYTEKVQQYATQRTSWMFLKSLEATPDLEWETVNMADPDTWGNYFDELRKAFSLGEIHRIQEIVMDVNGINQKKIDEATKNFLAGREAQQKQ